MHKPIFHLLFLAAFFILATFSRAAPKTDDVATLVARAPPTLQQLEQGAVEFIRDLQTLNVRSN